MPTMSLKITRPPTGAADLGTPELGKPLFRGTGDTDYPSGSRGSAISASMGPNQRVIVDAATCATCGEENEFPRHLRG